MWGDLLSAICTPHHHGEAFWEREALQDHRHGVVDDPRQLLSGSDTMDVASAEDLATIVVKPSRHMSVVEKISNRCSVQRSHATI